jgi:hypothetical protein
LVPGSVPDSIVDLLHAIDVDKCDDERTIAAPGALDLVPEREIAHVPPIGAGQIVKVRGLELGLESRDLGLGLGQFPCGHL